MFIAIRERHESEEGFTLIELLVVVIIIGILAAIAIPTFLNQRQNGYRAALTSDIRNGALEVETAFTANQAYPADQAAYTALNVRTSNPAGVTQTITYTRNTAGSAFCLVGTRSDLTAQPTTIVYDSSAGGMQRGNSQACSF